jgi:predicted membrane-bound dolichyl-phosphate-mannose-protein mannosyltransferase
LDLSLKDLYDRLFLVLLAVDIVLRALWLNKPQGSLIFDEWYYVNVARVILRLPQSVGSNGVSPYPNAPPGLDPNHEHPPLAKLIIALSMYLLGDNGFGWRIPSVIFGSVAVLVFYLLMKKITHYQMVPLVAAFLFSFDNIVFIQSRIAILDIFTLTFMLIGVYCYFSDHVYLSALALSLSTLCKATGAAGFLLIGGFHLVKFLAGGSKTRSGKELLSWFEKYIAVYAISFLVILTVLDRLWVGYANPFDHLQYILNYSTALVSACPNGIISCPWQWLLNQVQIPYLVVNVQVTGGNATRSFPSVDFTGAMNPAVLYLTIPAMLYSAYDYYQKKRDISLLSLVWVAVTYLPYFPAVIFGNRVTYIFYFLMAMPAVCAAISHMIADQNPPKLVLIFYLAVVVLVFYFMFPFKMIPS